MGNVVLRVSKMIFGGVEFEGNMVLVIEPSDKYNGGFITLKSGEEVLGTAGFTAGQEFINKNPHARSHPFTGDTLWKDEKGVLWEEERKGRTAFIVP